MENNELMTTEMEQENDVMVYDLPEEVGNSGIGAKVAVGAVSLGVAVFIGKKVADKYKSIFEEAKAARVAKKYEKKAEELRKAGYFVAKEEDCEVHEVEVEEDIETTEE